jgi:hypothetical protein
MTTWRCPSALFIADMQIMVGLGPIHPNKDHPQPPLYSSNPTGAFEAPQPPNGSVLQARHPTSCSGNVTNQQGHDLDVRLNIRARSVLTCWRLGTSLTDRIGKVVDPH